KGIELLMQNGLGPITISQTFTLSKITLSNPAINGGKAFYADWDRRYQYTAKLEIHPAEVFSVHLSWAWASGTPNKMAVFGSQQVKRLGSYHRFDLSLEYQQQIGNTTLGLTVTAFNLLNRHNS